LQPLLVEQESMKMKRFKLIVNTLKESGFFISPKLRKEMEGHLELKRRGKEWKKLYVVLFRDYLYMFKPHIKVSVRYFHQYLLAGVLLRSLTHFVPASDTYSPLLSF
jgi:hypothetical protein